MGLIIDLIIIGIITLSIFLGYKKGLVKLAISLCAVVIAIVATIVLYKPVSNFVINTTRIDETIQNAILEKAIEAMEETTQSDNYIQNVANDLKEDAESGILPETAQTLAINIVNVGVMIILYIAIKIALRFVTALADMVAKLPIINQFNKAGGIIYGLLRGLVIIYVVLLVISFAGQINPQNTIQENINQSNVGKVMYNNNILNIFLK